MRRLTSPRVIAILLFFFFMEIICESYSVCRVLDRRGGMVYGWKMRSYLRLKMFLAAFTSMIFIMGYATLARAPSYEIFPFYSWVMFALTPQEEEDYAVKISVVEGVPLDVPVVFQEAGELVHSAESIAVYQRIQRMGKAWEKGDTGCGDRAIFEREYFRKRVSYDLVKRRFDPIERWKSGRFEETRLMTAEAGP